MHDRLRLTQAKMPDEVQLELLAPWYTQNTSESRTLDFFDAIPKYPFAVTTTIPKPERLEVPFTLRGKKYTAFVAPAQITDARTGQERLVFPGSREELVERALRFIAVQQIAKTKLIPDAETGRHSVSSRCPCCADISKSLGTDISSAKSRRHSTFYLTLNRDPD